MPRWANLDFSRRTFEQISSRMSWNSVHKNSGWNMSLPFRRNVNFLDGRQEEINVGLSHVCRKCLELHLGVRTTNEISFFARRNLWKLVYFVTWFVCRLMILKKKVATGTLLSRVGTLLPKQKECGKRRDSRKILLDNGALSLGNNAPVTPKSH